MSDTNTAAPTEIEASVTTIVHFTDGLSDREAFYLRLLKTSLDDETLFDLRINIAGLTGSIEISHFPFCGKKGAVVPDSFTVQDYLTECLGIDTTEAKMLHVYMKDEDASARQDSLHGANVSSIMDAEKLARLKNQVDEVAFKQITGTAAKYVPELEQRDWAVISDSNALCYGIRIVRMLGMEHLPADSDPRGIPIGIERARSPAFRLKKRTIMSDSLPSSTIEGVKLELRVPDYIIDDKSYISIYETETEIQSSMATSSFSEADVSAAASGSYMGFSGSASISFATASSQAATNSSSKKTKRVTIAYNFPRVTIFLDNRSLELTPECEADLRKIKDKEGMYAFQAVYGEFFASRVQLGGRLFATETVSGTSASSASEKASAMKLAAAASFGGYGVEASASASAASGADTSKSQSSSDSTSSLTWQANGGDTLLCNKPSEWAPTVSYHWNWRVTKQDQIASIFDVASQLPGLTWLTEEASKWGVSLNSDDILAPPGVVTKPDRNTITLRLEGDHGDGRYLLSHPYTACDIGKGVALYNQRAGSGSKFSIAADLQARGAVMLGPKKAVSPENQRLFECEDENGDPVREIKWNTKYHLRNIDSQLFVDGHLTQGWYFVFGNSNRANSFYITFQDVEQSSSTAVIPDGSVVIIRFWEYQTTARLGYMYVYVEDDKQAFLSMSNARSELDGEARMILKYK